MTPEFGEALKWLVTFLMGVAVMGGGWWCSTMDKDIKKLQLEQKNTEVALGRIEEALKGRNELNDERWKNLDSKIEILHKDVQALVHSQLKPKSES